MKATHKKLLSLRFPGIQETREADIILKLVESTFSLKNNEKNKRKNYPGPRALKTQKSMTHTTLAPPQ